MVLNFIFKFLKYITLLYSVNQFRLKNEDKVFGYLKRTAYIKKLIRARFKELQKALFNNFTHCYYFALYPVFHHYSEGANAPHYYFFHHNFFVLKCFEIKKIFLNTPFYLERLFPFLFFIISRPFCSKQK